MIPRLLFLALLVWAIPCFGQKPTITSFSPTSGPVGTAVVITGTNFSATPANNIVFFGNLRTTVTAATSNQLTVTVPAGATYNTIIVLTNGLQAYSNKPFTVTFPSDVTIDAGFYADRVEYPVTNVPSCIVSGDLDGDGKLDLVTSGSSGIGILMNTNTRPGVISFDVKSSNPTALTNPLSLSIVDLDGDGKLDLAFANSANSNISIFRNTTAVVGSFTFESKGTVATGANPRAISAVDIDNDGRPDLVTANNGGNSISVLKNTSSGAGSFTFSAKVDFATSPGPFSVLTNDLDGDGSVDVALSYSDGSTLSVLRNTSAGGIISFNARQDLPALANSSSIACGDLDGDGKPDLVGTGTDKIAVHKNTSSPGAISYAPKTDIAMPGLVKTILGIGDLDGDGKADLMGTSSMFKNTSASIGSFGFSRFNFSIGSQPLAVCIGDFDGDGKPDVAGTPFGNVSILKCTIKPIITSFAPTSGFTGTSVTITGKNFQLDPSRNSVYFGAVRASITSVTGSQLVVTVPAGATFRPISVAIDGLQASTAQPFAVTFNDAANIDAGSFSDKVDIPLTGLPRFISAGDFDADGKVDLVTYLMSMSVYKNTSAPGAITFDPRKDFSTMGSSLSSASVADLDSDGMLDIAVTNSGDGISVYLNNTTSTLAFTRKNFTMGTGSNPASVTIGDIDGDGRPDLAAATPGTSSITLFKNISPGPGTIEFVSSLTLPSMPNGQSVHFSDIDKDGKQDLIVTYGNNKAAVFRNITSSGTFAFSPKADFTVGSHAGKIATMDIDNDGKQDIIVVSGDLPNTELSILRNTTVGSTITFVKTAIPMTVRLYSLSAADLNGDGKPDLAVSTGGSKVSVFKNTTASPGVITFAAAVEFLVGAGPSPVIADFDLDGKPDIITTNEDGGSLSILKNAIAVTVTGLSVDRGIVGTPVTITGQNFSTTTFNNVVKFNGVPATVNSSTNTSISVNVPPGATTGKVTVTSGSLTGTSSIDFIVAPGITSFTPTRATVGTPVTISGINFSATPANNTVKFNGTTATVTASTISSITTSVPPGATNGAITVTVGTQTATSTDEFIVAADKPSSQPTSLVFNNITSFSLEAVFNAATGSPLGYLILQKEGSASTDLPNDGTTYSVGNNIGSSKIIAIGSSITFNSSSLVSGATYYYRVFAYNGSDKSISYLTTSPLEGSKTTLVVEPTNQPSAIVFSEITTSSLKVSFTAPTSNVLGYIAIRRAGQSPAEAAFVDGVTYSQGSTYGQSQVVYVGTQTSFTTSGLSENTFYYFDIFAFNGTGTAINYLSVDPLEGNRTTLAAEPGAQPTNMVLDNISTSSIRLSFTAAVGSPTGYLLISKSGTASADVPVDGTTYASTVGTTVTVSELNAGTTYYFDVYSFNGTDQATNYLTVAPLEMSAVTLPPKPVTLEAVNVLTNSFKAKWSETLSAVSYELDVSASPAFDPLLDGYAAKPLDALEYIVTSLLSDKTYYYRVRAKNGSGYSDYSNAISVTTTKDVTSPATTGTATDVGAISAKLNGTFSPNGLSTKVSFEYGPTTELGSTTTEQTIEGTGSQNISAVISDLTDNSNYYFRIVGSNANSVSKGSIIQFTTAKVTAITGVASKLGLNSATLDGVVNTFGASAKVYFEWGLLTEPENKTVDQTIINSQSQTVSASLTNLTGGTGYFFRIVAVTKGGIVIGNNQPFSTISKTDALSFTGAPSASRQGDDYKLSVTLQKGSGTKTVALFYRKISGNTFTELPVTSTTNTFETTIPASNLDQLGLEYFFKASDATVSDMSSDTSFIYTPISQLIPNLSPGGQPENYRIISVPVKMTRNDPATVFNSLMVKYNGYDVDNWRLLTFEPGEPQGKNVDFGTITQIEPGRGYWFNSLEKADVTITGTAVENHRDQPFLLKLKKGWNMIGNPFLFNVAWSDILASNDDKITEGVGTKFYEYDATRISFKQSDQITAWSGGFVKATSAVTLEIPVTIGQSASRIAAASNDIQNSQLDQPEWFLPLRLAQGQAYNEIGGIGMHPNAKVSNDRYDEQSLPRFQNYLELNSYHHEFFLPRFARDVVPTQDSYQWDYVIESNFTGSTATLSWDAYSLGNNMARLKLYDEEAGELIDMKETDSYSLTLNGPRKIQLFYSIGEKGFKPNISGVGKPYPNPFAEQVTIPFFTGTNTSFPTIALYDLTGRKVKEIRYDNLPPDFHYATWDGSDETGSRVAAGTYLYRFTASDHKPVVGRIVVK